MHREEAAMKLQAQFAHGTFLLTQIFFLLFFSVSASDKFTINTSFGQITGNLHHSLNSINGVFEFLGIQYAEAPVGSLRFRPSQILNPRWNATYNATSYGPWCIQSNKANSIQSENCLFLNIWTPQINSSQLLPVQFWIHGGAFIHGSGSDASFNGMHFVSKAKDIVLVTINYRLGPLGFLQSKQLFSEDTDWKSYGGMNGIYDQIQALNWVKRYISNFGGNPDKITIFGESAGGLSVCMLMISPLVQNNTFQRAIQQSGACTGPWSPFPQQDGLQQSMMALEAHNLSTDISELRKVSAFEFQWDSFNPSVDGLILTELPIQTYVKLSDEQKTVLNAKDFMIGFNSMDGIIGYPWQGGSTPNTSAEYNKYISTYIKNQSQIELIETVYYPLSDFIAYDNRSSASIAWQTINGDVCVSCPSFVQMRNIIHQMSEHFSAYFYEFRGSNAPNYAPHASEIPFIFDHASNETFFDVDWNQTLSDSMLLSWANFGKNGVPNTNINGQNFDWLAFGLNDNVIIFDDNIRMKQNYFSTFRHNACSFWYDEVGLIPTMQKICYDLSP